MQLEPWGSALVFVVTALGLGWPLAARLALAPAERIAASVVLSLTGAFVLAWVVFVCAWPAAWLRVIPALAVAGLWLGRKELAATWQDADARALVLAQGLVAAWCVGWLATIASYSGGGWAGDWLEHWERARFFVERWPRDARFIEAYTLPARPPLANVVTGACLQSANAIANFAAYQLVTTLWSSLAFLPGALLARRLGGARAIAVLAALLLVSPMFVQNATFPWTKLPTAGFVLTTLYFLLRAAEPAPPHSAAPLAGLALGMALLTHYSAAVYAVVFGAGWLVAGRVRWSEPAWRRRTAPLLLVPALLGAVWLGWAAAVYGWQATLFSNTSATESAPTLAGHAWRTMLNLRDTLVPFFLRDVNTAFLAQRSPWGWWRDMFFQCYQINLPLAFGSVAWLATAGQLAREARAAPRRMAWFWGGAIAAVVLLGIAVNGHREHWGLAHICLQPLVLLGLAYLAARWTVLGHGWRLALVAGATVDLVLGILLHFGVQSYALDRWLAAGRPAGDTLTSYSGPALLNLSDKINRRLAFVTDVAAPPPALVLALLAAILILTLVRTRAPVA
jgi:hypothetical protein